MANGFKTGGRAKGTPNRETRAAREGVAAIMARHGFDPIEAMVLIAKDELRPTPLRLRVLIELAGYVYPKLSSVKVAPLGRECGPVVVTFADVKPGTAF